jgi:hypothetical protein
VEGTPPLDADVRSTTAITVGHAVAWADFDGDGDDELVAGWRDGAYGLARYRDRQGRPPAGSAR